MKKVLSPIVYAVCLALVFFLLFAVIPVILGELELEASLLISVFTVISIDFVVATVLFWYGNKMIAKIEALHKAKIVDHFRQSSICYLALLFVIFQALQEQILVNNSKYVFSVIAAISICVWAIFVNGIFLLRKR